MKNYNYILLCLATLAMLFLQSCEVVGGIFKAGVWVGILIVVVVIVVIIRLFTGNKGT